jgi:hypothetical protein
MIENRPLRNPPVAWYETGWDHESAMTNRRGETSEIWLRGNLRPVVWLALVEVVVGGGLIAAAALRASSLPFFLLVAVPVCGMAAGIVGVLAWAAARPRLQRVGRCLRVRLSPTAVEDVPLDAVECFFQGSNPIDRSGEPTCGDHATLRVNTLVMRLAERAADFSKRATFTPWGTWDDGYVVFDGRWCEPLSADLARRLSRHLLDAKRSLAEGHSSESPSVGGGP